MLNLANLLVVAVLVASTAPSLAGDVYVFRARATTIGGTVSPPGAVPTTMRIGEMSISDMGLTTALKAALGDVSEWTQCGGTGKPYACSGDGEFLFLHRSDAAEFGAYYVANAGQMGKDGSQQGTGFYLTNNPSRTSYLKSGYYGGADGVGPMRFSPGSGNFDGLYQAFTENPSSRTENGWWRERYTVTGGTSGQPVLSQFAVYKRPLK